MTKVDPGESQRRTGLWVAIGLLLLVFGLTIALTLPAYVDRSNPFWFVGMLVIFGGSLALIAMVFSWLGLASREESFALPSGSVRTLLAVGVMVLFSVFGLASISVSDSSYMSRVSDQPIATAVASAAWVIRRRGIVAIRIGRGGGHRVVVSGLGAITLRAVGRYAEREADADAEPVRSRMGRIARADQ